MLKFAALPVASGTGNRHDKPSDGQEAASPCNHKTESLAHGPGSQSISSGPCACGRRLACKARHSPTRERARSSPQTVTAAALERFLSEQLETSVSQRSPASIILRLKSWREANDLSQAEAVRILVSAGVPAKLSTLRQWEIGRRSPAAITTAALQRFLEEHPKIGRRSFAH